MESLYKILDVLMDTLGPTAIKEHCEKQQPADPPPTEQKKIIIKKVKKSTKVEGDIDGLAAGLEGLSIQKAEPPQKDTPDINVDEITSQLQNLAIQPAKAKAKTKPETKAKQARRCDARIYGDKLLIEGTVSPNGSPYVVYKHAQCESNASHSITDEDDGKLYLCKMCMKRYTSRQEFPVLWHGFFDVDDPPHTSHFVNGKWHRDKVAALAPR
jgi:hypothetical protein